MSAEEVVEIGHRELRNNLARALAETVKQERTSLTTCQNRPDGYLVSRGRYAALRAAEMRVPRMADTAPLLLAAAGAGAAIPSTSCRPGCRSSSRGTRTAVRSAAEAPVPRAHRRSSTTSWCRRRRVTDAWYPRAGDYWVDAAEAGDHPPRQGDLFAAVDTPYGRWDACQLIHPTCELAKSGVAGVQVIRVRRLDEIADPEQPAPVVAGFRERAGVLHVATHTPISSRRPGTGRCSRTSARWRSCRSGRCSSGGCGQ